MITLLGFVGLMVALILIIIINKRINDYNEIGENIIKEFISNDIDKKDIYVISEDFHKMYDNELSYMERSRYPRHILWEGILRYLRNEKLI